MFDIIAFFDPEQSAAAIKPPISPVSSVAPELSRNRAFIDLAIGAR
jgi:hypothetical protein